MRQLGDILLEEGLVGPTELAAAYEQHRRAGGSLGWLLVEQGVLTQAQLVAALAQQIGLPFVDLGEYAVDRNALTLLPASVCRRHALLPVASDEGRIVIAMADPANVIAVDDVRTLTGLEARILVATREDVEAAIDRFYRADTDLDTLTTLLAAEEDQARDDVPASGGAVVDAPIVRYVNLLIAQAVQDRASDIHIEPEESALRVRYRIDGVLHEVMRSPRTIAAGVTSRVKIMAELDIAERRVPQDGRLSVSVLGRRVDLRVATLPTVWGEKVVMRVLDNSTARLALPDLGFTEDNYTRYAEGFSKPHGMVLVTGPTGSGKSTTLYATLNVVNRPEVNVITVEDPVEYRLPGVNQVQVHAKAGLTFAASLRSILRCDPDVVLVGEIRDQETARIAVEAALTGHLVLSTLHTNDAPSALTRLAEMGIEPYLVGSALECVLAQRLARRLCMRCREPYEPEPAERQAVLAGSAAGGGDGDPAPVLYRPVGCAACARTGFRGRVALHEVMTVSESVERLAVAGAPAADLATIAREEGMSSLRADGLRKVRDGVTSLEEVLRVVG